MANCDGFVVGHGIVMDYLHLEMLMRWCLECCMVVNSWVSHLVFHWCILRVSRCLDDDDGGGGGAYVDHTRFGVCLSGRTSCFV